jgi:uncharacterized protein (DUF2267 family)
MHNLPAARDDSMKSEERVWPKVPIVEIRFYIFRGRGPEMREISELGRAVADTDGWIDDLAKRLGWRDRGKAYAALIGALHGLRDALPREEVVYFGAQLPLLLRGLYYEGWHPGAHRSAQSLNALCARIHEAVNHDPGIDSEAVARSVLALLAARLSPSDIEDVIAATPRPLHALWPS